MIQIHFLSLDHEYLQEFGFIIVKFIIVKHTEFFYHSFFQYLVSHTI